MGGLLECLHVALVAHQITARHSSGLLTYPDILSKNSQHMPSRLEDTIVGTFSRTHSKTQIFVHWGPYESGKSRAAKVAAARLLQFSGKTVMLLQGYRRPDLTTLRKWLRWEIGMPPDRPADKLSVFLPGDKQALVILDHADMVLSKHGASDTYNSLQELEVPVLVLVSSWEHALDLKKLGAQVLGTPGFARWTKDELAQLYHTLPDSNKKKRELNITDNFMECATLAGCPGILINDAYEGVVRGPNMLRTRLIDAEWRNGIRALNGEDMQGVTGRFPDKKGVFHWDLQKSST
jgi:hypothetical protein